MDEYMGSVMMWAGAYLPENWMYCHGQTLQISEYQALYAVLGFQYGGDGRSTFALPDLRGRAPVCAGQAPNLAISWKNGLMLGQETVTLTEAQLASHSHGATVSDLAVAQAVAAVPATVGSPEGAIPAQVMTDQGSRSVACNGYAPAAAATGTMAPAIVSGDMTVDDTGSSAPVPVIQPSFGIDFIICVVGTFPPRANS